MRSGCKRCRSSFEIDGELENEFKTIRGQQLIEEDDGEETTEDHEHYRSVKRYIQELNNIGKEEELLFSIRVRLWEFIRGEDLYHGNSAGQHDNRENPSSRWVKRGCGQIRFLKQLEQDIHEGTIHMKMLHEKTRRLLLFHSVDPELEARSLVMKTSPAKNGGNQKPSYVWTAFDHADYKSRERTFAVQFRTELEALEWKEWFEHSRRITMQAQLKVVAPSGDLEIIHYMEKLSTICDDTTPSPKRTKRDHAVAIASD